MLTLDSTFDSGYNKEEIKQISFITLSRLNSDIIEILWIKKDIIKVNLEIKTILEG